MSIAPARGEKPTAPNPSAYDERFFFRLIPIGVRKFSAEPETRDSEITLILANALRLAVRLLGRRQAAKLALWVLEGGD